MAWVVLVGVVLAAVVAGAVALRGVQREVEPTVKAFSDFRAALQPAVAQLGTATAETRSRFARISERGPATRRR